MSFISDLIINVSAFRVKIGEKLITLSNRMGNLPSLTTTNKTSLVSAINEVNGNIPMMSNYVGVATNNQIVYNNKKFQSLQVLAETVTNITQGWNRIATLAGRGYVEVVFQTTGGSQTPVNHVIKINMGWSPTTNNIDVDRNGTSSYIRQARVVRDNNINYLEVDFTNTIATSRLGKSYLKGYHDLELTFIAPTPVTDLVGELYGQSFSHNNGQTIESTRFRGTNFIKDGGSNNEVLLAGGSSKPISDFVSSNDLGNYLPLSGGTLYSVFFDMLKLKRNHLSGGSSITFSNNTENSGVRIGFGGAVGFLIEKEGSTAGVGDLLKIDLTTKILTAGGQINTPDHGNSYQWKQSFDWGNYFPETVGTKPVSNTSGDYYTVDLNNLIDGSYAIAVSSATNVPSSIGTIRGLFRFGCTHVNLKNDIIIGANGMSFRTSLNNLWRNIWTDANFTPSNYALLSQVYTQTQALSLFVGVNGVQTINDTKTFSSSPIVPNGTLAGHTVNLGQLNTLLVAKTDVRLSNLVSDLSTNEKATIKNKLGIIDTTYTNGTGLDLTNNVFSLTIAIQNSISKGFTAYGWGNHASAGYALSSQLANYVPVNGAFTINGTKTFSSSPVVPNARLSSHAVNLGQVYNIVNNVIISNDIVEFDLLITDEFQSILDNIPQIGIEYAKCYYRNKTFGIAIKMVNSSSSPVDVFGSSSSIVSLFTLPDEIMYRINQSIRELIPQFKLQNSDPVSSYSSYQTFVELEGTIKHPYGLLLSENYKTVIYGEFECLDMV